jgi:hypothetical protein
LQCDVEKLEGSWQTALFPVPFNSLSEPSVITEYLCFFQGIEMAREIPKDKKLGLRMIHMVSHIFSKPLPCEAAGHTK